ncbi:MAG: hypothetical protein ACPG5P_09285, partial [Saprospiraceae bacterium]
MKTHYILFFLLFIFSCQSKEEVKPPSPIPSTTARDTSAHEIHYPLLKKGIVRKGMDIDKVKVHLKAFKKEQILEVWISENEEYQKFRTYPFCAT